MLLAMALLIRSASDALRVAAAVDVSMGEVEKAPCSSWGRPIRTVKSMAVLPVTLMTKGQLTAPTVAPPDNVLVAAGRCVINAADVGAVCE